MWPGLPWIEAQTLPVTMTPTPERFELRKLANGWAVWDLTTNAPAVVEGRWKTDMDMEAADDMVDLLNRLDREAKVAGGRGLA